MGKLLQGTNAAQEHKNHTAEEKFLRRGVVTVDLLGLSTARESRMRITSKLKRASVATLLDNHGFATKRSSREKSVTLLVGRHIATERGRSLAAQQQESKENAKGKPS